MTVLNINGAALKVEERGKGEVVVFVHGSASDYRTWKKQVDQFAKEYRVVTYSRRFHWPNERIPDDVDYSMAEQVNDLGTLILKLNVSSVHLVGHSYGAFLCLLLAIKKPQLVKTLALSEPPAITLFVSSKPKPLEILKLLISRPRTGIAMIRFAVKGVAPAENAAKRDDAKGAGRLLGKCILGETFYSRLTEERLGQVDANAIKAEFLGSGFAALDSEQLRNINVPVLLVCGEHSNRLFHRIVDRLEELISDTRRVEIPDASHIMHEDNAEHYNRELRQFLKEMSNAD